MLTTGSVERAKLKKNVRYLYRSIKLGKSAKILQSDGTREHQQRVHADIGERRTGEAKTIAMKFGESAKETYL